MAIGAKISTAFSLAAVLLVAVGIAAIFFVGHLDNVLAELLYYDSQATRLAKIQAEAVAHPEDRAAQVARLRDLGGFARTAEERRLAGVVRQELQRDPAMTDLDRRLVELDAYYLTATTAAHRHLVVIHRRAVWCTIVAVADGTLMLVLLMILVHHWLLRPVEQLDAAAIQILADNGQPPVTADGPDELARLAHALSHLTGSLRTCTERLQRSERLASVGEACTFVAHNLREPLVSIRSLAARGRQSAQLSAEAHTAFDRILVAADTLERWVREVVTGMRPFEAKPVRQPIEPILHDALALVQRRFDDHPIEVQVQITEDLPQAPLDASLLEQALVGLLINAIEASPPDGRIVVSASNQNQGLTLTIEDQGKGMNAETQRRACDPFFTTKPSGPGLGLTIARRVVESHGGHLAIDSQPGRGTRINVSLPTAAVGKNGNSDR